MPESKLTIENIQGPSKDMICRLIKIEGFLDESNIEERAKTIYDLIEQNPKKLHVILDLEKLDYMNSKSIGYLTDWADKITKGGGRIIIAHASSGIIDILNTVGISNIIKNYPNVEEAKSNLFI